MLPDRRFVRAARSLYTNRERRALIEARIAAADSELRTYLALNGLTLAVVGAFEVKLDGDDLHLTRRVMPNIQQLELPELATVQVSAISPQSVGGGGGA